MSMTNKERSLAELTGRIVGWLIAISFLVLITPWVTLGSINRLFDLSVAHTLWNYLYFWVIVFAFNGKIRLSRGND